MATEPNCCAHGGDCYLTFAHMKEQRSFQSAAGAGKLRLLKWPDKTHRQEIRADRDLWLSAMWKATENARRYNQMEVIQWLHSKIMFTAAEARSSENMLFRIAAESGSVKTIQWLHAIFNFDDSDANSLDGAAFIEAASLERNGMLLWLCSTFRWSEAGGRWSLAGEGRRSQWKAMHAAATCNLLRSMQWLHKTYALAYTDAGSRTYTILEDSARNGYLAVVQWLCTTFAIPKQEMMDCGAFAQASKGGYLDVMQYLAEFYDMTAEDAKESNLVVFCNAIYNGDMEMLQWLHAKFPMTREEADTCGFSWRDPDAPPHRPACVKEIRWPQLVTACPNKVFAPRVPVWPRDPFKPQVLAWLKETFAQPSEAPRCSD